MKRGTIAASWAASLLLARTADAAVTYHYTPDLAREGNPLVSVLGQGWGTLLVVNVAVCALLLSCTVYWWRRPLQYDIPSSASDFWSFASFCYFRRIYPPWQFILRQWIQRPKNWRHHVQAAGFIYPPVITAISLFAILGWYGNHASPGFNDFYRATLPWFYIVPGIVLYYLFQMLLYRTEFRRWRGMVSEGSL